MHSMVCVCVCITFVLILDFCVTHAFVLIALQFSQPIFAHANPDRWLFGHI